MNATLSRFGSISLQKSMEVMIIIMLLFSVVRSSYAADPDPTKNVKNERNQQKTTRQKSKRK